MRSIRTVVVLLLLVGVSTSAQGFDGSRRGFVLGGGIGAGLVSFQQDLTIDGLVFEYDRENKAALVTDFHIGWGLSDTIVLTYAARVSWFPETIFDDVVISSGVGVVTLTRYAQPTAPSTFLRGGVGLSSWHAPFEDDAGDPSRGLGLLIGFGYEFSPHWSVELAATWGLPTIDEGRDELETNALSVQLVLVGTAY